MMFTNRVSETGDAIGHVRQFVSFHCILWMNWPLTLIFCVYIDHDHSWPGIESQGHMSRSMQKCVCYTSICEYWLTAVIVGFYCHIVSCALTWRGVRCGAAEARGSGGVQCVWACNAVGLTSILDRGQFL